MRGLVLSSARSHPLDPGRVMELRGLACLEASGALRALQPCQKDSKCSPDEHDQAGRGPEPPVETDGLKIES